MASFFAVVFAGAAGEQLLETLGGWSRETSVADRMWSEGRKMYDAYHCLRRPGADTFATACVGRAIVLPANSSRSPHPERFALQPDTTPGGFMWATGTDQGGTSADTADPGTAAARASGGAVVSSRKRGRKRFRCSECDSEVAGDHGFSTHLGMHETCAEMGADMVEHDPDEERGKALIDSAQAGQYKPDVQSFLVDQYASLRCTMTKWWREAAFRVKSRRGSWRAWCPS
jgi:hypothetical protein